MSEVFGPKDISIKEAGANALGAFIAGLIGSSLIIFLVFIFGSSIDIAGTFSKAQFTESGNILLPFIISIITLIGSTISIFSTYLFLTATDPERYKRTFIHLKQIAFFILLTYIFITPIYLIAGAKNEQFILGIFIIHITILSFGTSIILEILNNYRHILTGVYGTIISLFVTILLTGLIYLNAGEGITKLIILIGLLPIINTLIIFVKELFLIAYNKYYKATGLDPIGDIFYQIEIEEKEELRQEIESNI